MDSAVGVIEKAELQTRPDAVVKKRKKPGIFIRSSIEKDVKLASQAMELIDDASREFEIAKRSQEYLAEVISSGNAVLAFSGKKLIGFAYIRKWNDNFVSHSALVVARSFHGQGIGRLIKNKMMELSFYLYPTADIISLTTNPKVRKMNLGLGFKEVPALAITKDPEFWRACSGCREFGNVNDSNSESKGQETPCGFRCCCGALLYRREQ